MSTTRPSVAVHCDGCADTLPTSRTTPAGARGDAGRKDWLTSATGDGYRSAGASSDHARPDLCPECRPDRPTADVGLFADHNPQEDR